MSRPRAPLAACNPLEVALAAWSILAGLILAAPGRVLPSGSMLSTLPEWLWSVSFLATGVTLLVGLAGWRLRLRRLASLALFLLASFGCIGVWQVQPGSWVMPVYAGVAFWSAFVYHHLG